MKVKIREIQSPIRMQKKQSLPEKSEGESVVNVIAANKTGAQQAEVSPDMSPSPNTEPALIFLSIFG